MPQNDMIFAIQTARSAISLGNSRISLRSNIARRRRISLKKARFRVLFSLVKDCYYYKSKEIVRFRNVSAKLPYDFNQSNYMTVESR
ncbi:MAG: hypothetical protein IKR49_06420, partial [Clostridia bacterium]|nr:hypothetical protein [Clostridia bacterium]